MTTTDRVTGDEDPALDIRHEKDGRLVLTGELDLATAPLLEAALARARERGGDITLDMAGLEFMDSTGIKVIITSARRLEGNGSLILRAPGPAIRRVLDLVQIERVPAVKIEMPE